MPEKELPELKCNIPCDDAIKTGVCRADCCRTVSITFLQHFYDSLSGRRYCEPDDEFRYCDLIRVFREDCICVFLDQEINRCNIYDLRPQVCSEYGKTSKCLHFTPDGRRLTKKEKRLGHRKKEYDTQAELINGHKALKSAWNGVRRAGKADVDVVNESAYQQRVYTELRSLATPAVAIKALRQICPDMVEDVRGTELLTGGGA